ncbi:hypothetical protein [Elizabethkingia anophelis]|uniref:hypothetical protein n=1 Tax=Elizabethkingia anophelis TaxID=1117645 RepID=UPI0024050331|nr:hypothetical protein [Elizabethkingia anophelis]
MNKFSIKKVEELNLSIGKLLNQSMSMNTSLNSDLKLPVIPITRNVKDSINELIDNGIITNPGTISFKTGADVICYSSKQK